MTAVSQMKLRLDFLPTKAESTLERCALLALQPTVQPTPDGGYVLRSGGAEEAQPPLIEFTPNTVQQEKHRLAAEWQRHQLVPPTPSPAMRFNHRFEEERRGFRVSLRESRQKLHDAVSGVLNKVVKHMQPTNKLEWTSPSMKKTDSTNTVSTADTESSPTPSLEPGEDFDDLVWWNLLPSSP
jgi:hypothetical protein